MINYDKLTTAPYGWLKRGDEITVRVFKHDETSYRWWHCTVETVSAECLVTTSPPGKVVTDHIKGDWQTQGAIRTYYWLDRFYSLLEVYWPSGELRELYVNINSPAILKNGELLYTDYELDVVQPVGEAPFIDDEDEFAEAALRYGYTPEFQKHCYEVVQEALRLAQTWQAKGCPT